MAGPNLIDWTFLTSSPIIKLPNKEFAFPSWILNLNSNSSLLQKFDSGVFPRSVGM